MFSEFQMPFLMMMMVVNIMITFDDEEGAQVMLQPAWFEAAF